MTHNTVHQSAVMGGWIDHSDYEGLKRVSQILAAQPWRKKFQLVGYISPMQLSIRLLGTCTMKYTNPQDLPILCICTRMHDRVPLSPINYTFMSPACKWSTFSIGHHFWIPYSTVVLSHFVHSMRKTPGRTDRRMGPNLYPQPLMQEGIILIWNEL